MLRHFPGHPLGHWQVCSSVDLGVVKVFKVSPKSFWFTVYMQQNIMTQTYKKKKHAKPLSYRREREREREGEYFHDAQTHTPAKHCIANVSVLEIANIYVLEIANIYV